MNQEKAEAVRKAIADHYGVEVDRLFLADHNHEGLSEGSWSIAAEEGLEWEWPWLISQNLEVQGQVGKDVFMEAINHCILGIHDS